MTLKEKILDKLEAIEDKSTLEEILQMISVQAELEQAYKFTPKERASIEKGLADANNGDLISQEDSEILVRQWLREKSCGL